MGSLAPNRRSQRIDSVTQKVIKKLFCLTWMPVIEPDTYSVCTFPLAYHMSIKRLRKVKE